jgi:hypothetical protein
MKGLLIKVIGVIAGSLALFGISVANVKASVPDIRGISVDNIRASVPDISGISALYLEHGKYIGSSIGTLSWHVSHGSHESHGSHVSHSSGY